MASSKSMFRNDLRGVDAYTRHKKLIRDYTLFYNHQIPKNEVKYKTEIEIIRENHKFIRNQDEDEAEDAPWEQRAAKKYYDKLFKEYAIGELKYYKESKIALRWRTEGEVVSGQFVCASTRCDSTHSLESWEVNFRYAEDGEVKNELVKIRLCPSCSDKLNYTTQKRLAKKEKKDKLKRKRDQKREQERDSNKSSRKRSKKSSGSKSAAEDESQSESESESEEDEGERMGKNKESEASNVWKQTAESREERSKEEEFEDYFADLLQ
ncbi:hypothetical protein PHYBLDRAFT_181581 [Phycomyces blakesleeanus NRRL 1555(-)]|uniref:Protein FRA10AC1 n=1 Tax=Phycomyces blakesleeanus (strain ATCC 8743b / DSM 1359 / FGSC 10004 / NBRC 33097 / NRRL 1555) TaxID=763407 RepID=A0A167MQP0_PHYB8|nr:hypothetical protein PHYBLDRAFT_181581 [Phycomyces blakesleeanus NRRL 1555(-)]OAD73564.1 hypothetical protein PHYBLDRAFT_181581 [Phycomyces blakesleeanus NRRL 1555(-)]|eukprot:XP_018291604.1 hypothetical protein PHYBLDRAFT_181581 [Phycomyces blakesleeanus NRRL 1555(-)]